MYAPGLGTVECASEPEQAKARPPESRILLRAGRGSRLPLQSRPGGTERIYDESTDVDRLTPAEVAERMSAVRGGRLFDALDDGGAPPAEPEP